MRAKLAFGSKPAWSKSAMLTRLRWSRYCWIESIRSARRSSSVAKSETCRGRSRCASVNSVRALSQTEKWLRSA
jgi:hypothetical protein